MTIRTIRRTAIPAAGCIFMIVLGCNGFFVDPTVQTLNVGPSATINEGGTQQMSAVAIYTNGDRKDVTGTVAWSASPQDVLKVDDSGLVTGLALGSGNVTASYQTLTATADMNVDVGDATALAISPQSETVQVGKIATFQAFATTAGGKQVDVTVGADWAAGSGATVSTPLTDPVEITVGSGATATSNIDVSATYVSNGNPLKVHGTIHVGP